MDRGGGRARGFDIRTDVGTGEGRGSSRRTARRPSLSTTKTKGSTGTGPGSATVRPNERLSRVLDPVRDAHRLPGLIGAIVRGDTLTAIGAVGIRKI